MFERDISREDIINALKFGIIIENYPNDYPYPSCLVLGNYLHVVCGIGNNTLWIITVYRPSFDEWENDWKHRKEKK
jgi:hypothetical protein